MRLVNDDVLGTIAVWQEAQGECFEGKVAVAEVIRRRTRRKYMSDGTIAGTIFRALQFSGFNSSSPIRARSFMLDGDDPVVRECAEAWRRSIDTNYSGGAVHYYAPRYCNPVWARGAEVVAEIGQHRFVIPEEG